MSGTRREEEGSFASPYRRAFAEYDTHALWNKRMLERPKTGRRAGDHPLF